MAEPLVVSFTYTPGDIERAARYAMTRRFPLQLGMVVLAFLVITRGSEDPALNAVGLLIGLVILVVYVILIAPWRYAQRASSASPTATTEPTTITLSDDGMEMVSAVAASRSTWRAFHKVIHAGSFVGLQTGATFAAMVVVPRRALGERHAEFVQRFRAAGVPVVETRFR